MRLFPVNILSPLNRRAALCGAAAVIGLAFGAAVAQELEIAISPSPVGSGARAAGMADAFVAIADDATAASWNPAGLIQLELPEISIVGSYNSVHERFHSDGVEGFGSRHSDDNFDLNYLSVVWPLPIMIADRNLTAALSYQRKYDFSRSFDVTYLRGKINPRGVARTEHTRFSFVQEGGLSSITPALAVELTPKLALGLAVNLWRSSVFEDNGWIQEIKTDIFSLQNGVVRTSSRYFREEHSNFRGENFSIGLLWRVNDRLSVGARHDTAFTGKADYKSYERTTSTVLGSSRPYFFGSEAKRERRQVRFPASTAVGLAYRFSDQFWMSLDVTRTDWDDFWVKEASGTRVSLIDASNIDRWFDRSSFDSTVTVRLGAEYLLLPKELEERLDRLWTLRGGVFYDQEPAAGKPDDFYGAAAGVGLLLRQRVNIDWAYQVRFGNSVNSDFFRGIPGFKEDVVQHRVLLSTVIYF